MSFSINTNLGALAALQSLDATQQSLNNTQNIISTGQLVSSASNNPAIYSISQTMQANIAGLAAVQDNLSFGQSVLGVESSDSQQISSQLATLQQTVTQAQQSGISTTTMQNQINAITNNIQTFADNATFNGVNLLANSSTASGVQSTNLNIQDSINAGNPLTLGSQLGTSASATILSALGLSNLNVNSGGLQISFSSSAAFAAGDYLQLSAQSTNATSGTTTNNWIFQFQTSASAPVAAPSSYTLGTNTSGGTNSLTNVIIPSTASPMEAVGAMISSLQQAGFGASLDNSGNLTIVGNNVEFGTTSGGTTTQVSGFVTGSGSTPPGYSSTITSTTELTGTTAASVTGTAAAITMAQSAVGKMNNISANIGAMQQQVTGMNNFSSALSTSLTTGLGALTDANMAAESAQLNSLQTKQQLAIRTLSIANAQPQVLLNLFQ